MSRQALLTSLCMGSLLLFACGELPDSSASSWASSLGALTGSRLLLTQSQVPWQLSVLGLSEAALRQRSGDPPGPATSALTTVAIKLRMQSQDLQHTIPDLLATQAPTYSAEQAQDALFYHMAAAGYLQVGETPVRPRAAYVEMTTNREQCVDLVFVFALARRDLARATMTRFVVDKAFFLSQPVEFVLPATQLLDPS